MKRDEPGGRPVTTLRLLPVVKERVQKAAVGKGLSFAQEVERRLEQSFRDEEVLGGAERAALLRAIGALITTEEAGSGKPFNRDAATWVYVSAAINTLLRNLAPPLTEELKEKHASFTEAWHKDVERDQLDAEQTLGRPLYDLEKDLLLRRRMRELLPELILVDAEMLAAYTRAVEAANDPAVIFSSVRGSNEA